MRNTLLIFPSTSLNSTNQPSLYCHPYCRLKSPNWITTLDFIGVFLILHKERSKLFNCSTTTTTHNKGTATSSHNLILPNLLQHIHIVLYIELHHWRLHHRLHCLITDLKWNSKYTWSGFRKINYDWKTSNDEKLNLIICFSPLYEVHLVCTSHGTLMLQSFVPNLFL